MIVFIVIVILLACFILAFFVLIQNPKGGGLTGTFGSISSQMMGVKQSTDVMERGTWTMISVIGALCIVSVMFLQKPPKETTGNPRGQQQKSAPAKK
jgi:preprotein translocase subunit SecG